MNAVMKAESLSKRFTIYHGKPRSFQELWVNMFRSSAREDFWALHDVNLEVHLGETLGIVGANGSGKSTLLKLLARIIEPTTGKLTVTGRVSALLELGAGFHPDLTGKENIYLNGALLGIPRKVLDRKFDEIVDFAELERFIYTPLKHYSAGMIMRLGFTISLSLDPDILLIDEILAVGDASFQRKCMDRIRQLTRHVGATILVSHDLSLVRNLCTRAIWLQNGTMAADGPASQVVSIYLESEARRYQTPPNGDTQEMPGPVQETPASPGPG
ncbi:MAG: ABC transporter ATP-binding protein [Bacteroidetes bacterium]|nr:ABC transporter ATP-binding protein [Bacteroidota bacterium]MCL5026732.1 ABC transporter ATP-binding protein [Chloroflexota bacterium]